MKNSNRKIVEPELNYTLIVKNDQNDRMVSERLSALTCMEYPFPVSTMVLSRSPITPELDVITLAPSFFNECDEPDYWESITGEVSDYPSYNSVMCENIALLLDEAFQSIAS